ncbi:MAG: M48 family metallopeptidase [Albidovulum sp.]
MTGAASPSGAVAATYLDGVSAARQAVTIEPSGDLRTLAITLADGSVILWPFDRLREISGGSDRTRLTLALSAAEEDETGRDAARLVVADPAAVAWFRQKVTTLDTRDLRAGTGRKVALWLGGAVAAVVLMLFVILPAMADYMAAHLSVEAETALGATVMKQVEMMVGDGSGRNLVCDNEKGLAALRRLQDRLAAGAALKQPITLSVFDSQMVNAFAAPGGQVVIFRGLLNEATSADEVAGVLAHEIGHVAARDPTRIALRSAGSAGILALILGDVSGGTTIALAGEYLLTNAYTRDAEAAADGFALGLLASAGISSAGMADFFEKIAKDTDSVPEMMSSHPLSEARAQAARIHAAGQGQTEPALSDADWQALKAICD